VAALNQSLFQTKGESCRKTNPPTSARKKRLAESLGTGSERQSAWRTEGWAWKRRRCVAGAKKIVFLWFLL
jgi:hypothetical protein